MNCKFLPSVALATLLSGLPVSQILAEDPSDPAVATVDGKPILKSQLDRAVALQTGGNGLESFPEDLRSQLRLQALDGLIADLLVGSAAEAANVEVPKEEVERFVSEIQNQVGGKEKLESELARNGVSMSLFREDVEKRFRQESWARSQIESQTTVTNAEIAQFYNDTPVASKMPERVRASHILLTFDKNDPSSEQAKLQEINAIREKIVGGEDFAILAKNHSQDPGSKDRGGDLNYFTRGRMVKEFEDAAFSLEPGQVSGPVKTEFGYHLILVTDKQKERDISLEEASEFIRNHLENRKRVEAMQQLVSNLRSKADVQILLK